MCSSRELPVEIIAVYRLSARPGVICAPLYRKAVEVEGPHIVAGHADDTGHIGDAPLNGQRREVIGNPVAIHNGFGAVIGQVSVCGTRLQPCVINLFGRPVL